MTRIELEIHDDIIATLNKIKNLNDNGVEIVIPKNSVLFENILNLKIIDKFCQNAGMEIDFITDDDNGTNLIAVMNDEGNTQTILEDSEDNQVLDHMPIKSKKKFTFIPKLGLPKFKFIKLGLLVILLLIISAIVGSTLLFEGKVRTATVNMRVDSQSLTRSITIKVKSDSETNIEQKILKGYLLNTSIEELAQIETTGEKLIGKKAKGEITLYNSTDEEKKIKKGTIIRNEDDLEFVLQDTVTIPSSTQVSQSTVEKGSIDAEVEANDIGEKYNLQEEDELEVDDYKRSQINAYVKEDFDGGSSETLKVVAPSDLTKLREKIAEQSKISSEEALRRMVESGKTLIKGSYSSTVSKETFSHKVDEEVDDLKLTQTINVQGLAYGKNEVDDVANELVVGLIPEGYELSEKDTEISIEVLGNTTVANNGQMEADIQVTIKTYIIAKVDEESLKERLVNKSTVEAENIIREIQNVKTYSVQVNPDIKLFKRLPSNKDQIFITVERN